MAHDPNVRIIKRFNPPTKMDTANHLTLCRVGDNNKYEWYIQLCVNAEIPRWEPIGNLNDEQILLNLINLLQ